MRLSSRLAISPAIRMPTSESEPTLKMTMIPPVPCCHSACSDLFSPAGDRYRLTLRMKVVRLDLKQFLNISLSNHLPPFAYRINEPLTINLEIVTILDSERYFLSNNHAACIPVIIL